MIRVDLHHRAFTSLVSAPKGGCPGVPVHEGIPIVFITIHGVMTQFVNVSFFCVPVHEDTTPKECLWHMLLCFFISLLNRLRHKCFIKFHLFNISLVTFSLLFLNLPPALTQSCDSFPVPFSMLCFSTFLLKLSSFVKRESPDDPFSGFSWEPPPWWYPEQAICRKLNYQWWKFFNS